MKNDNAKSNTQSRSDQASANSLNIINMDLKSNGTAMSAKKNKENKNLSMADDHGPSPAKRPRLKSSSNNGDSSSHHRLVLEHLWSDNDKNVLEQDQQENRSFIVPDSLQSDAVLDASDLDDENRLSIVANLNNGGLSII